MNRLCYINITFVICIQVIKFASSGEIPANSEYIKLGIPPNKFGHPVEDDEAFAWDGPDDLSTAPGCPSRTFQLPWIYHGNPARCFLTAHKGPCNTRMKLFVKSKDEPFHGVCDCEDAGTFTTVENYFMSKNKTYCIHEKRNMAYYPPKRRCYYLFERGPCDFGEWLVINPQGRTVCEPRRCPKNLYDTTSYRTPYWFYDAKRDSCYQAYTRGHCPKNHQLVPTKLNWVPQCVNTKVSCNDLLPATVAVPKLRCSRGSYCAQILGGRKIYYTRRNRNNRHTRRRFRYY